MAALLVFSALSGGASARAPSEGYTCVAPASNPSSDSTLMLATHEFRWTFYQPVMSVEHQRFVATVPSVKTRPLRWNYDLPTLRSERMVLWKYPEMSCRYPVGDLPNDCQTVWRNVYADLPVLAVDHEHASVDVPAWSWSDTGFYIDVPHWTYVAKDLVVGVPAIVDASSCSAFTADAAWNRYSAARDSASAAVQRGSGQAPSIDEARSKLQAELAAVLALLDQSIGNLDTTIASIRASGGDPAKVIAADGSALDMYAMRSTMVEQKAALIRRYDAMIDDLSAASRGNAP